MPKASSTSGHHLVRHVAPFAPVALALLMGSVLNPSQFRPSETEANVNLTPVACEAVSDFEDCHSRYPYGCAGGQYDTYLDLLKNKLIDPPAPSEPITFFTQLEQFDPLNEKVPKTGLTKDNHGDFKDQFDQAKEGQLFGILGYLYYAKAESQESSNCELPDTADHSNVDFHIGVGFDSSLAQKIPGMSKLSAAARSSLNHQLKSNSVVVEMTPHFRDAFEKNIWTLDSVQKVLGKQVRVVGQLLADNDHNVGSQNCFLATKASEQKSCWRYSIWELHPVVSFQVCRQGTCTQNSGDWVELDQM